MHRNQPCSGSVNTELSAKLKRAVSSGDTTAVRRLLKGGVECSATFWVKPKLHYTDFPVTSATISRNRPRAGLFF